MIRTITWFNIWRNIVQLKGKSLVIIGLLGFTFTLQFFFVSDFHGNYYSFHEDYVYYGRLATFISTHGFETSAMDVFSNIQWTPEFYHYLELWQGALVAKVFHLNTTLSIILIIFSFWLFLVIAGFLAFIEKREGKIRSWHYFLAPVILFAAPFTFMDIAFLFYKIFRVSDFPNSIFGVFKLSVFAALLMYLIINIKDAGQKPGFTVSVIGLVWPGAAPAIFTGYFIFTFLLQYALKISIYHLVRINIFPIITTILIGLFYFITGKIYYSPGIFLKEGLWGIIYDFYFSRYGLVSMVYIVVFTTIAALAPMMMHAIFFYFGLKFRLDIQQDKNVLILLLVVFACGLFVYPVFTPVYNSWQFHHNIYIVTMAILVSILFYHVFRQYNNIPIKLLAGFLISLNLIQAFDIYDQEKNSHQPLDMKFYNRLVKEIQLRPNANFGYFKAYKDDNPKNITNPQIQITGRNIGMFYNHFFPVAFSVFDIKKTDYPVLQYKEREFIDGSIFYRYVTDQKEKGSFVNLEVSVVDFVKEHNVAFILFEDTGQVPQILLNHQEVIIMNRNEGFGLVILDMDSLL